MKEEKRKEDKARLTDIQRFSVNDGPGIRTMFFFGGCPLSCAWCQNPETIAFEKKIRINEEKCIGCGKCLEACPNNGTQNKSNCKICGECTKVCFSGSRELVGKDLEIKEMVDLALKDRIFYEKSGGGITASGGEPLLQWRQVKNFFEKLKEENIHTAIETSGYAKWEHVEEVSKVTDLFLYDIKAINSYVHKQWTGVDNQIILDNVKKLKAKQSKVIIRVPLIPEVNDGEEFSSIAKFASKLELGQELHILPFHQLGESKYKQFGIDYKLKNKDETNAESIEKYKKIAEEFGCKVNVGGAGFL